MLLQKLLPTVSQRFSCKDALGIKEPTKADAPLNKETKGQKQKQNYF